MKYSHYQFFSRCFSSLLITTVSMFMFIIIIGCDESDTLERTDDSGTLVVLNKTDYTAMIIDMSTREVLNTLPTGVAPHEAAISPSGSIAVASNYGEYDGDPGHTLTVINLQTGELDREIDLGEYTRPHGLAWFDDGEHLAVTAEGQQALIVLHMPTDEIVKVITTDQERSHIVQLSSDNTRAFVANIDYGTMSVIDLEAEEVIALVETDDGAEGIAISPDESELWITNRYANNISIVDLETYEVIETLDGGEFPIRANFTPDGKYVLAANMNGGDVSVFNAKDRTEVKRIDLEPDTDQNARPVGMLIIPGNRILVAGTQTDRLYIIDLDSFEIIDHIPTGAEPDGMAFTN
ncbi:MAG: beta-propeller fold lactonase family protein [Balneolaceae bacterium]|nr:beta-propeller fold lactonase family protein [Balneolaceae bacterium]